MNQYPGTVADNSKRLVASFIDFALSAVAGTLGKGASGLAWIAVLIFQMTYWARGQSFGKSIMNLKVYRVTGEPTTLGTMFLREVLGKIVSAVVLGLGFLTILWDPEHRGWHDKIAGTVVIDTETVHTSRD